MGAELGATSSIFPSDHETYHYLRAQRRPQDWVEIISDKDCKYDHHEEIILDELEPLIALPSSPGNVVPVKEVSGRSIHQVVIGSSANPGLRDFWIAGYIVKRQNRK